MFKYLNEVRGELKNVSWPARTEVIKLTLIVVAISAIVSLYLGSLDFGFTKLLEAVIKK
jgi:preprotein translocase subunit SecE